MPLFKASAYGFTPKAINAGTPGAMDPAKRVRDVLAPRRATLEQLGCIVEEACPDLRGAEECFRTLRAWLMASQLGVLLPKFRAQLKPAAIEEIEAGAKLSGADVARAMTQHADLLGRMRAFHARYEFFACTVSQLPPFDVTLDWPKQIEDVPMRTYLDWMRSAYWITATFAPAISVPAGFTPEGLPVGIQLVGARGQDFAVLQIAHAFEQATRFGERRPALALA